MVIYTELTSKEISKFGDEYGLGVIKKFQPLKGGSTNSNYLLATVKGKYVLTICEDKTRKQTQTLITLLEHLANNNFHTSKALKLVNGEFLSEFDNKPVYLQTHFEGIVPKELSYSATERLGRMIARLHGIEVLDNIPDAVPYWVTYFINLAKSSHPYINWLDQKLEYFEENIPRNLPTGLVHGDIFLDNLIMQPNGEIVILDFEEVSRSPFIFDIGMALVGSCSDQSKISVDKAKSLINGYQQIRKLNLTEKHNIKFYAIYAATSTSYWRFRQSYLKIPSREKSKKHQQMVDIADSLFHMSESTFMKQTGLN